MAYFARKIEPFLGLLPAQMSEPLLPPQTMCFSLSIYSFIFCGAGDGFQGLTHSRQGLYL
jgi:hypothetical protein